MNHLPISILRFLWPLAVIAVILEPIIGMTASWWILAFWALVCSLLSISWLFVTYGELRGRIIATYDSEENRMYYFFELNGKPEKIETQDIILFEVVRNAENSSP
jgi:hypothetical protein